VSTFCQALKAALERVTEHTWRDQLDALHARHGTWKATAEALDVTPRTLERWRNGYLNRRGVRIHVAPQVPVAKVRAAVKGDRRAQAAAADWSRLRIKGTIELDHNPKYRRKENMHVGKYLTGDAIAGLAAAYVSRSCARMQAAIDNALGEEYVANGDTRLLDVEDLDFGQ
jgi:hypothetical protein